MKPLVPLCVVALALGAARTTVVPAADTNSPAPPSAAAERGLEGRFEGRWKGPDDTTGDLRLVFKRGRAASWEVEASFTFEGREYPTRTKAVRIDGARIEVEFEWSAEGNPAASRIVGELQQDTLKGTYETSGGAGETRGTWSVSRA